MAWKMKKAGNAEQELLWQCLDDGYIKGVVLKMEKDWDWSHAETFSAIIDFQSKGLCKFHRFEPDETGKANPHRPLKLSDFTLEEVWEDWSLFLGPSELTRKRLAEVGGMHGFFDREEVED